MTSEWTLQGSRMIGRFFFAAVLASIAQLAPLVALGQEAQWVWSPDQKKDDIPRGSCYFRKTFDMRTPEQGQVIVACDDRYELYVNGRFIASGEGWKKLNRHDVLDYLGRGANVVAIKVTNQKGSTAGLVARIVVKDRNGPIVAHASDNTWLTTLSPWPLWTLPGYSDHAWTKAATFGEFGKTAPWAEPAPAVAVAPKNPAPTANYTTPPPREPAPKSAPAPLSSQASTRTRPGVGAAKPGDNIEPPTVAPPQQAPATPPETSRFRVASDFKVETVLDQKQAGSLLAIAFNEFGQLICSQEGAGLFLAYDSDKDGKLDKLRPYCEQVKNCQGLLCLNGDVFAVGEGPDGPALYRLSDKDRNASLESVTTLIKFKGPLGEHGPHGLTLGPDGLIYVMVGNHTAPDATIAESSPHRNFYEGDLLPRYEDPGGHAVGVKVPGGTVIRTDVQGSFVETVCGGIRNAYDLCFNREGELFTHDSDMEADEGTTWYRPTRVMQLAAGGEYGWRSGWSTWPEYYYDSLPGAVDTGRGSPTGMTVYDHFMFPVRYHNMLFTCDWAMGRIMAVQLAPNGAGYTGKAQVFLEGEPLNATDIEVGPDGALYFCTGGRGTDGGIYRVSWTGKVPDAVVNLGVGISEAIRQPQPSSAWARQKLAGIKQRLGDDWEKLLRGVALSPANPALYRTRALDLLQWMGPSPTPELLARLAGDKDIAVRRKAVQLLGLHGGDDQVAVLVERLGDEDASIRRAACDALLRMEKAPPFEKLIPCLASEDRFESWAARRLLERIPADGWRDALLDHEQARVGLQAGLALSINSAGKETSLRVIESVRKRLTGYLSDRDFLDLLRLTQVAIARGGLTGDDIPELRDSLGEEYPSSSPLMNRELIRILTHLQSKTAIERTIEQLNTLKDPVERVHLGLHLRFFNHEWTSEQKLALVRFYEEAANYKGGSSYAFYVRNVLRDFAKNLNFEERKLILAEGEKMPNAALAALYGLPDQPGEEVLNHLKRIDTALAGQEGDAIYQLQIGVVAVLAREKDPVWMAYLRDVFEKYPERRHTVALGLAQQPDGENWKYLVRALPILDGPGAQMVLMRLKGVELAPEEAEYYRAVIVTGLKLKEEGAEKAIALLEHWTGEKQGEADAAWDKKLAAWQAWFSKTYPTQPEASLPTETEHDKWKYQDLVTLMTGKKAPKGSPEKGALVFEKAQCNRCHKFEGKGDSFGPDLTSVGRRFQLKEILEATIYPSAAVSDQYGAKQIVTTDGRTFSGLVVPAGGEEVFVVGSDGKRTRVRNADIAEQAPTRKSPMPEGLLNQLSIEEIVDLMAYLKGAPIGAIAEKPGVDTK